MASSIKYIPVTTAGALTPITQTCARHSLLLLSVSAPSRYNQVFCYNGYMQSIGAINNSYYCEQDKPTGPILVLVTGAYRVAEFDSQSGNFKWHRVVPAPQRAVIENWLNSRYPRKQVVVETAPRK